jgi:UDP-3-O-acyl-N-acetylglucosamine deacetylase
VCNAAPSGQGIVFRRIDLPGSPVIPARLSEVQSTERRTVLGQGETVVQTVEHLLAATAALQIDDLTIDLDGPEPPIGDGSFAPYLTALEQAGIVEQPGDPVVYRVTSPSEVAERIRPTYWRRQRLFG